MEPQLKARLYYFGCTKQLNLILQPVWPVCIDHELAAPATPVGVWTMHWPYWPHRP